MISYQEHFTFKKILLFTFPSIIMMIFTSIYGMIDGLFLSNFVGKTAFTAVNFILPFLLVLNGFGFMFGSGGSALIAKKLGEGENDIANEMFTSLTIVSLLFGILIAGFGYLLIEPIALLLGASGNLLEDCLLYGRIYLIGIPLNIVQYEFQNLFITAKKPNLGLISTIISGVLNIILDAIFIAGLQLGLVGAAVATVISISLGGLIPIFYFLRTHKECLLRFKKTKIRFKDLPKICSNGLSELLNNISMSIVSMIYNAQLIRYAGENGVAAYGILMYINFLFMSIYIGYSIGISPVISYNYGARKGDEINSLLKKSLVIILTCSILMVIISETSSLFVSNLFASYDEQLLNLTRRGFFIFSFCFLFSGFGMFSTSFFTALNNGVISAVISVLRTLVFQLIFVFVLPLFMGVEGIWLSVVLSEALSACIGIIFILVKKKKYTKFLDFN